MVDVGDLAPDFSLKDQDRNVVALSDLKGKNVVLFFYPFAFSGICSGELCSIRDDLADFSNDDVATLGISTDTVQVLKAWSDQQGYGFPLLTDFWPHGAVAQSYGVFSDQAGCAVRATFVIDRDGTVVHKVVNAIGEARDHDELKKVVGSLS